MDTKKSSVRLFHYIILIPHRDALNHLEEYRQKLFSRGVPGAHSFPASAPLAGLSRPLSREELRELARNIRNLTKGNDGKIKSAGNAITRAERLSFFGPALSLSLDDTVFPGSCREKALFVFKPPVLCAAIINQNDNIIEENLLQNETPALSFRAAALANLAVRPLSAELCSAELCSGEPGSGESPNYSFEWRIGPPVWLPTGKRSGKK